MSDLEDELGFGDCEGSPEASSPSQQDWSHITKPGPHDVLLGRGGGTNNHSGNVKFRKLVNEHKMRYLACSKVEKPRVAREVVQLWRKMDPPGRFLARKDDTKKGPGSVKDASNVWYEVGDKKAREKASQCLRERTPDVLPYIKQLRQQQDHFTEQGVNLVQQQLRMQEAASIHPNVAAAAAASFHPAQRSQSMSAAHVSFGRRNSMAAVVQQHLPPNRRSSMPAGPTPVTPPGQHMSHFNRRGSLPAMGGGSNSVHGHHSNQYTPEHYYVPSSYDLHSISAEPYSFQQQSIHMESMQQQQQQAHRNQSSWGYDQQHHLHPHQQVTSYEMMEDFEPLPVAGGTGGMMSVQQPHHSSISIHSALPDMHHSARLHPTPTVIPHQTINMSSPVEVNEVTLEEYRKSLEEYISNNQIPTPTILPEDDPRLTPEMDMPHNTWIQRLSDLPTEKEQVLHGSGWCNTSQDALVIETSHKEDVWKQQQAQQRYKNQQQHSTDNKSHTSGMSGSVFSEFSLEDHHPNSRESKMNMARQLGSNMSMMSELTDLSETVNHMQLHDLEA